MKKAKVIDGVITFFVVVLSIFIGATSAGAKDWHELRKLDDAQLTRQIEVFHNQLKQQNDDYEAIKGLGIAYHFKAQKNKKKFAPKAVAMLTRGYEQNKSDVEILCYLGSATTMMAHTTWNPIKKMHYANKGTSLMDKAVRKAPNNVSVRMTRGYNSMNLPKSLAREHIALEDFGHLAKLIESQPGQYESIKKEVLANLKLLSVQKSKKEAPAMESNNAENL